MRAKTFITKGVGPNLLISVSMGKFILVKISHTLLYNIVEFWTQTDTKTVSNKPHNFPHFNSRLLSCLLILLSSFFILAHKLFLLAFSSSTNFLFLSNLMSIYIYTFFLLAEVVRDILLRANGSG